MPSTDDEPTGLYRQPYRRDAPRLDGASGPADIRAFVRYVVEHPDLVDGVTVWNFSTHRLDHEAATLAVSRVSGGPFIVPLQIDSYWHYAQKLLPRSVRRADYLIYSTKTGRYSVHPNYRRLADDGEADALRAYLAQYVFHSDVGTTHAPVADA
jgi:hypothetical protein